MKIAMVLCLVLAGACKTDGAEQPAASSSGEVAAPSESGGAKPRSGKIEPPPRLPSNGQKSADDRPAIEPGDMSEEERFARREAREERREERRKERMEQLDQDKNGEISPEELQAGRKQRAEEMRNRFDANGDGKLTTDELSEGRMGRRLDPATIDTNKDGDISADELSTSMEKMRERFRGMRGSRGERGNWGGGSNGGSADQP